jgi:hypothetical protein
MGPSWVEPRTPQTIVQKSRKGPGHLPEKLLELHRGFARNLVDETSELQTKSLKFEGWDFVSWVFDRPAALLEETDHRRSASSFIHASECRVS